MGDVNLEIKLSNLDERVIKIEESGGGSGGDDYITSVSNDFNVVNKKLSLSNDVTTKLSKVDYKIDKPASATDGQVLTYNGTSNEWEAKNPSASITEPTDLEKGIIGGDEYSPIETYGIDAGLKNICIYNNKIYLAIQDSFNAITPTVTSGWETYWKETSISEINSSLSEIIKIKFAEITLKAPTSATSSNYINLGDLVGDRITEGFFVSGKILNSNGNWYTINTVSDGYCYVTIQNNSIRVTLTANGVSPYGGKDVKAIIAYY